VEDDLRQRIALGCWPLTHRAGPMRSPGRRSVFP
jgi:hypothetical protein